MTKTGKVFYLVIDRTKDEETVHFLTDISENDLLNVTDDNKPTLPQNSAVVIKDAGLEAGSGRDGEEKQETGTALTPSADSISEDSLLIDDSADLDTEKENPEELSPLQSFLKNYGTLIAILVIALLVIVGYMILKFIRKDSDEDYVEDEEGEDPDYDEDSDAYDEEEEEDFIDKAAREDEEEKEGLQKEYPKDDKTQALQLQSQTDIADNQTPKMPQETTPKQDVMQSQVITSPMTQDTAPEQVPKPIYQPYPDKPEQPPARPVSVSQPDPVYMPYRTEHTDMQISSQQPPQPSSEVIYEDPEEEEPEEDEDER